MTIQEATRVAKEATQEHGVDLVSVGPNPHGDDYEVRVRHRTLDWYGAIHFALSKPLDHFRDEVFALAETCAEGPSS